MKRATPKTKIVIINPNSILSVSFSQMLYNYHISKSRSDIPYIPKKILKQKHPVGSVGFMCEEQIWV